jgi:uncharacterized protein (DUF1499 family)
MKQLRCSLQQAIRSLRLGAIAAISLFSLVVFLGFPQTASASTVRLIPTLPMASLFHFSGPRPSDLGVKDGQLKACPGSPNCVSSQSRDAEHSIAPIATTNPKATLDRIAALIKADDSAKIITCADDYINAEYTSALMGFVDDVEFWANADADQIEVRSASRLGESDLGVNRKRIEAIRTAL